PIRPIRFGVWVSRHVGRSVDVPVADGASIGERGWVLFPDIGGAQTLPALILLSLGDEAQPERMVRAEQMFDVVACVALESVADAIVGVVSKVRAVPPRGHFIVAVVLV